MGDVHQVQNGGHVVLISSPFAGHIIPLLDLAQHLSAYYHVTCVVSASKLVVIKRFGLLIENENNTLVSTQSGIDFIGLFDHNDKAFEVSVI